MIDKFDGEYAFLSNFYECPVQYGFFTFSSSEAAFQSAKTTDETLIKKFVLLNPSAAKKLGRKMPLRKDWEQIKDTVMYQIVLNKFRQNLNLREKLLATGNEELVEGNWWNDTYWGRCNGVGKNKLGKILMEVRKELRST